MVSRLGHIGIHVEDVASSTRFYTEHLGLIVTDGSAEAGMVFLSAQPELEHHEILLCQGRDAPRDVRLVQQISFRCDSLEEVLEHHRRLTAAGVTIDRAVSHGNAVAFTFPDPDGNRCEIYWDTGISVRQPLLHPIDLTRGVDEILAEVDASVEARRAEDAAAAGTSARR
jgi:catechol 2,3-dioxygenase-like lactoylglutathione lyase family enzyme